MRREQSIPLAPPEVVCGEKVRCRTYLCIKGKYLSPPIGNLQSAAHEGFFQVRARERMRALRHCQNIQ